MTQDQWNAQAAGDALPEAESAEPVEAAPVETDSAEAAAETVPAEAPATQGDGDNAPE
jgi:hypothetical protein